MRYTKLQISVIRKANRMLKKNSWYRGICTDIMDELTDYRIKRVGVYRAAKELYYDTEYYDNPSIWGGVNRTDSLKDNFSA